jgi:methylaspartate mutase epsilon subunit
VKAINKRWSDGEFEQLRKEVLSKWPSGKEVNLDEAVRYHKGLPKQMNYPFKMAESKKKGISYLRTDSGVATLEEEIELFKCLQDVGTADFLGTIVDSFTRTLQYEKAEQGLKESLKTGKSMLNGFPVVAHGVKNMRKITEAVKLPIELRAPTADIRLALEIALASGHTASNAGSLPKFWHYTKDMPLEFCQQYQQYLYRLLAAYEERGVPMLAEISGGFSTASPFSIPLAGTVIDALMAAEQGVKNVIIGLYGMQGNLVQDVAACITFPKLGEEYLRKFGYKDVNVYGSASAWSGMFPEHIGEAYSIIALTALIGVIAKANIIHFKTISERVTIPSKEDNANSIRAGRRVYDIMKVQNLQLDQKKLNLEIKMMEMEAKAMVDKVIELGNGDVMTGTVKAVELGMMDQVFATTKFAAGKVIAIRDAEGAVRYLDHGNLPFNKEIIEFNREKVAEREKYSGRKNDYKTVVDDIYSMSKGPLVV